MRACIPQVAPRASYRCGTLKNTLQLLVPTARVFLDVDDLESISLLEKHIQESDVVLIVVLVSTSVVALC